MSEAFDHDAVGSHATPSLNVGKITGMATALVAVNVLLMLALSYTPAAELGAAVFSNFFIGIAVFAVTVGGGFWLSNRGIESGSYPLAGVGVTLTQAGYGLFGSAVLVWVPSAMRIPALAISAVVTGAITAAVALYVFNTERSFAGWQNYAFYCFVGGVAIGAVGFFLAPTLMVVAGLCFFLGFVVDLVYEIWAVRENRYASDLRNALGIYVAVMGVFIHVLMWVLRILSMLEN